MIYLVIDTAKDHHDPDRFSMVEADSARNAAFKVRDLLSRKAEVYLHATSVNVASVTDPVDDELFLIRELHKFAI